MVLQLSLQRFDLEQLAPETVDLFEQHLPLLGEVTVRLIELVGHALLDLLVTLLGLPERVQLYLQLEVLLVVSLHLRGLPAGQFVEVHKLGLQQQNLILLSGALRLEASHFVVLRQQLVLGFAQPRQFALGCLDSTLHVTDIGSVVHLLVLVVLLFGTELSVELDLLLLELVDPVVGLIQL